MDKLKTPKKISNLSSGMTPSARRNRRPKNSFSTNLRRAVWSRSAKVVCQWAQPTKSIGPRPIIFSKLPKTGNKMKKMTSSSTKTILRGNRCFRQNKPGSSKTSQNCSTLTPVLVKFQGLRPLPKRRRPSRSTSMTRAHILIIMMQVYRRIRGLESLGVNLKMKRIRSLPQRMTCLKRDFWGRVKVCRRSLGSLKICEIRKI